MNKMMLSWSKDVWTSKVTERQNRQKNSQTKTDIAFWVQKLIYDTTRIVDCANVSGILYLNGSKHPNVCRKTKIKSCCSQWLLVSINSSEGPITCDRNKFTFLSRRSHYLQCSGHRELEKSLVAQLLVEGKSLLAAISYCSYCATYCTTMT